MAGDGSEAATSNGAGSSEGAAMAESFKEQGNAEYKSGRFLKAAALYTQGLKADPNSSVLYRWLLQSGNLCHGFLNWQRQDNADAPALSLPLR